MICNINIFQRFHDVDEFGATQSPKVLNLIALRPRNMRRFFRSCSVLIQVEIFLQGFRQSPGKSERKTQKKKECRRRIADINWPFQSGPSLCINKFSFERDVGSWYGEAFHQVTYPHLQAASNGWNITKNKGSKRFKITQVLNNLDGRWHGNMSVGGRSNISVSMKRSGLIHQSADEPSLPTHLSGTASARNATSPISQSLFKMGNIIYQKSIYSFEGGAFITWSFWKLTRSFLLCIFWATMPKDVVQQAIFHLIPPSHWDQLDGIEAPRIKPRSMILLIHFRGQVMS